MPVSATPTTSTPYKDAFQDWTFIGADFETIRLALKDFVHADPPHDVEFTTYAKGGFPPPH